MTAHWVEAEREEFGHGLFRGSCMSLGVVNAAMRWSARLIRDLEDLEGSRWSRLCLWWSLVFGLRFGKWLCQGVRVALGHTKLLCVCCACYD